MKNNAEQNEGENLYFPRSSFGARRKKVSKTVFCPGVMQKRFRKIFDLRWRFDYPQTEQSYQNPFNSYPGSQDSQDSPIGKTQMIGFRIQSKHAITKVVSK